MGFKKKRLSENALSFPNIVIWLFWTIDFAAKDNVGQGFFC